MRERFRWLALLMAFGLVLAACGGGDGAETTTTTAAATTTTAGDGETTTTAAPEPPAELATDFGVDTEAQTITLGLLSDLTGPFGPLVTAIVEGIRVYWEDVNANGGVNGYTVNLEIVDTQYVVDNHVQLYGEMKDKVVALQHSTGSPHTVAIVDQLAADSMLAVPLTWYSGWSDSAINANLVSHGAPYCIEAMNAIGYIVDETGAETIAIASLPGDYGQDSAAGAKLAAEALGLEIVYDGEAQIIPTDETTLAAVANGIVGSGADMVWIATTPGTMSAIYGQALAAGFEAAWSGPSPNWSPAFVAPGSPIADALARDYYNSTYLAPWFDDASAAARELFTEYSDAPPLDYYLEGFVEAKIMHDALLKAFENGDVTRAGVLAAAKSLESVNPGDFAPTESYVGADNDRLQRQTFIGRPDPAGLAGGTSTGWTLSEGFYTHPIAEGYEFDGACFKLG
jgi:ABC-type branched-subunit amino acid transport system substrate-binding protein